MTTLRQRIRKVGIKCTPWNYWKNQIKEFPVSAITLFKKDGIPIDLLEIELRGEGWIKEDENLIDILFYACTLKRQLEYKEETHEPFDETWTENDYKEFYKRDQPL